MYSHTVNRIHHAKHQSQTAVIIGEEEEEEISGATEEEEKPAPDGSAAHINLKVKGQFSFASKGATQLKKLMNAYCDRQSYDLNSIAFLFDAGRLGTDQTPEELEMEDGDEIDAMLHQTGGSGS
ncbi:Small ubiquitin-related modifier 1-like protein [Drosera capensis]